METYQNPVVTEQQEPAPITLQISALVLGIISFVFSFIGYFASIFGNIVRIASYGGNTVSPVSTAVVIAIIVITMILAVVAIILGTVGLVRSIRRPRTVKGIVLSGIGLSLGIGGLIFSLVCLFITGIFTLIIMQM